MKHFSNIIQTELKTKFIVLGDIPSPEFLFDLRSLNSLRISHCETKLSEKF